MFNSHIVLMPLQKSSYCSGLVSGRRLRMAVPFVRTKHRCCTASLAARTYHSTHRNLQLETFSNMIVSVERVTFHESIELNFRGQRKKLIMCYLSCLATELQ